jgi:hypothetical protein
MWYLHLHVLKFYGPKLVCPKNLTESTLWIVSATNCRLQWIVGAMNCRCYELSAMNCRAMNCLAMNGRRFLHLQPPTVRPAADKFKRPVKVNTMVNTHGEIEILYSMELFYFGINQQVEIFNYVAPQEAWVSCGCESIRRWAGCGYIGNPEDLVNFHVCMNSTES